jgi:hypothetical protein
MSNTEPRTMEQPARHRRRILLVLAIVVALGAPTIALASHTFTDVPDTNVHHDNISAIAEAGVTLGCTPTEYCPEDFVRRDAMGSFMARLGGLGNNPPVANAAHAEMLAGQGPSAYTTTVFSETLVDAVTLPEGQVTGILTITNLPAGEYVINAQATAHRATNPNTDDSLVRCRVDAAGVTQVRGEARSVGTEPVGLRRITFPMLAHVSALPDGSDVELLCASLSVVGADPLIVGSAGATSGDTVLIVTRVGD